MAQKDNLDKDISEVQKKINEEKNRIEKEKKLKNLKEEYRKITFPRRHPFLYQFNKILNKANKKDELP